ncbi:hypothetical protein ACLOJK_031470 [Asimina triloba]
MIWKFAGTIAPSLWSIRWRVGNATQPGLERANLRRGPLDVRSPTSDYRIPLTMILPPWGPPREPEKGPATSSPRSSNGTAPRHVSPTAGNGSSTALRFTARILPKSESPHPSLGIVICKRPPSPPYITAHSSIANHYFNV